LSAGLNFVLPWRHFTRIAVAHLSSWASGVIWKFAAQAPGVKKVVIVTENTDYGIPAAEEVVKDLKSKGITSVTFGVDMNDQPSY